HLQRSEVTEGVKWVEGDLEGKSNLEKLLVIKGKRGVGKSTILKDIYDELSSKHDCLVLAIKCDQFYYNNLQDLTLQLFNNILSFREFISAVKSADKKVVIILDQLDALSQTLSSDRRYIQTYVKLIDTLIA